MSRISKTRLVAAAACVVLLPLAAVMRAQAPVVDRSLQIAGAGKFIAPVPQNPNEFIGDDFPLGGAGETWIIERIRAWALVTTGGASQKIGDVLESITLFGTLAREPIRDQQARDAECECHAPVPIATAPL